jgi:hypothetical protein
MKKIIGISGLIFTSIIIYLFEPLITFVSKFVESFTPDKYLEPNKILIIKILFIISIIILLLFSLINFLNIKLNINKTLNKFIDTKSIMDFFLKDNLCTKKKLPIYLFLIGTISSLVLHLLLLALGKPPHEGILETYSTPLFLFAGLILFISTFSISKLESPLFRPKILRLYIVLISLTLLYIFGEEISWGQRIFGWESFGTFEDLNFQNETNIHNFFNPIFKYIYPTIGISGFIITFLLWFFPKKSNSFYSQLLIPHPCLFYIVFILAASSFKGQSEIFEALLAIFAFLYSIRVFMCLKFPNNN